MELTFQVIHQLRPAALSVEGKCGRCARTSHAGGTCADCLANDLGKLIGNKGAAMRWLESVRQVAHDERMLFLCADREDALGR